jgi:hypothetical protein
VLLHVIEPARPIHTRGHLRADRQGAVHDVHDRPVMAILNVGDPGIAQCARVERLPA